MQKKTGDTQVVQPSNKIQNITVLTKEINHIGQTISLETK